MEIESRRDQLTVALPRESALALSEVAEQGLRLIEELNLVQRPAATEHALGELRA
jgi:hypothetical protein